MLYRIPQNINKNIVKITFMLTFTPNQITIIPTESKATIDIKVVLVAILFSNAIYVLLYFFIDGFEFTMKKI